MNVQKSASFAAKKLHLCGCELHKLQHAFLSSLLYVLPRNVIDKLMHSCDICDVMVVIMS